MALTIQQIKHDYILAQLKVYAGNVTRTAKEIGMSRTTLSRYVSGTNIDIDAIREAAKDAAHAYVRSE